MSACSDHSKKEIGYDIGIDIDMKHMMMCEEFRVSGQQELFQFRDEGNRLDSIREERNTRESRGDQTND